jgi:hypothetical protein
MGFSLWFELCNPSLGEPQFSFKSPSHMFLNSDRGVTGGAVFAIPSLKENNPIGPRRHGRASLGALNLRLL